jgi:hypothetical protein
VLLLLLILAVAGKVLSRKRHAREGLLVFSRCVAVVQRTADELAGVEVVLLEAVRRERNGTVGRGLGGRRGPVLLLVLLRGGVAGRGERHAGCDGLRVVPDNGSVGRREVRVGGDGLVGEVGVRRGSDGAVLVRRVLLLLRLLIGAMGGEVRRSRRLERRCRVRRGAETVADILLLLLVRRKNVFSRRSHAADGRNLLRRDGLAQTWTLFSERGERRGVGCLSRRQLEIAKACTTVSGRERLLIRVLTIRVQPRRRRGRVVAPLRDVVRSRAANSRNERGELMEGRKGLAVHAVLRAEVGRSPLREVRERRRSGVVDGRTGVVVGSSAAHRDPTTLTLLRPSASLADDLSEP